MTGAEAAAAAIRGLLEQADLGEEAGLRVTAEMNEKGAEELVAEATKLGFEAKKEKYEDPLESSGATADFW